MGSRRPAGVEREMNCRRSSDIDLPGFLDEPRRPEFAAFRDHYPRCRDCSAEVRAWTALQKALRTDTASAAHPEPELLARYSGATLAAAERGALERHLATCAACRDELGALERWTPALQVEPAPARASTPGRVADGRAALRRLLWSPAFAYALLALVLVPTLYRQLTGGSPPIEPAAQPAVLAEAEKQRRSEEPPAAASEPKLAAKLARQPEPERKAAAERTRAAAPPPPAVAYAPQAPASAGADRGIASLGKSSASAPKQDAFGSQAAAEAADRANVAEQVVLGESLSDAARARPDVALALRAGEVPVVAAAAVRAGLHLLVTALPAGPGEIEIRVVGPGGGRELRERHPADARDLAVELPPDWLAPGRYQASVRRIGSGLVGDEARYAFEVAEEAAPGR
jgi:hypothetical protein